jgi:DNA-binding NarL/FixJ family response regulator
VEEALGRFGDKAAPNIALMDIHLPGMSGIEGIRRLKDSYPETVFLVLSVYDDDERIFEALCAGASGYLLKKTPPAKLLEALREAVDGGGPLSPEVAQRVIHLFREFRPPERSSSNLTPHEVRILRLISEGHDYPSAATELNVATSTIVYHMRQIFGKLQVHSKSEAVAKALRTRLLR